VTREDSLQTMTDKNNSKTPASEKRLSRRHLLLGGAAAGAGAVAAVGADMVLREAGSSQITQDSANTIGLGTVSPYGAHQAGIISPRPEQAHVRYASYDLLNSSDGPAIQRMLRVITDDIEKLTQGEPALADSEPELAQIPANLTVTVGFGPTLVSRVNPQLVPEWLAPLPAFSKDALEEQFGGGDLLFLIQTNDPVTLAHAHRMLLRDLASFATLRWVQTGFRRAAGAEPDGTTMRNLMGQVDGTTNPDPAVDDFDGLIWEPESAGWLAGGSAFVLRRINMLLDTWDKVDRPAREQTIGRDLAVGAPLTGTNEHDVPDFNAVNSIGLRVIPPFAHMRRAHSSDPNERILRQSVNFEENGNAGLFFGCYQVNPLKQFVPIQQRLDELDLLNEWIVHVGSSVFAIPPGFEPGDYVGETLFTTA